MEYHWGAAEVCLEMATRHSLVTLAISVFTLVMVLRKPAPVALPVSAAAQRPMRSLSTRKWIDWSSPPARDKVAAKFV